MNDPLLRMNKIRLIGTMFLLSLALLAHAQLSNLPKVRLLVDTHGDILFNQIKSGIDIGQRQSTGNFDLVRAKEGGLNAQVFSVWCDHLGGFSLANRQIDSLEALIGRYPDRIALVKDATSLERTISEGKLAAMIGVEGGHMIENRLGYLDKLADRGMLYLTLTWNNSTPWASSAAEETSGKIAFRDAGLNKFGAKVIKRLNKKGIMIDLSHVGERTFYDALRLTTKPVIVSHSSVHAFNQVPRNLKDEQLKAIQVNGGLVSLNFYSGFLDSTYHRKQQTFLTRHAAELKELSKQWGRSNAIDTLIFRYADEAAYLRPPISLLIDHIDHIVNLIGVEHVGLGADFDGAESFPLGINSVADYPKVLQALADRGYTQEAIEQIAGRNFLRVLRANRP